LKDEILSNIGIFEKFYTKNIALIWFPFGFDEFSHILLQIPSKYPDISSEI